MPDAEKLYREKHRPLFHFTSRVGWLNDPNGLVYHDGEWHLFYQHNPYGAKWGNMHWGHAVSKDLVHWKELGIAPLPEEVRRLGVLRLRGGGQGQHVGWGTKEKPPLVLAYTSTGRGECIAFSNDNGRTWTEYDKNPVVKHAGRDPKLVWHEKGKHWVMAVYDEDDKKQWIAFYTSPDLKAWTFASRIEGFYECPDLFELPVRRRPEASNEVGAVRGGREVPARRLRRQGVQAGPQGEEAALVRPILRGPDVRQHAEPAVEAGRPAAAAIQIGWAQGVTFPGMPFNQQMTVPVELCLRTDGKGGRRGCRRTPVVELPVAPRAEKPVVRVPEARPVRSASDSRWPTTSTRSTSTSRIDIAEGEPGSRSTCGARSSSTTRRRRR